MQNLHHIAVFIHMIGNNSSSRQVNTDNKLRLSGKWRQSENFSSNHQPGCVEGSFSYDGDGVCLKHSAEVKRKGSCCVASKSSPLQNMGVHLGIRAKGRACLPHPRTEAGWN